MIASGLRIDDHTVLKSVRTVHAPSSRGIDERREADQIRSSGPFLAPVRRGPRSP